MKINVRKSLRCNNGRKAAAQHIEKRNINNMKIKKTNTEKKTRVARWKSKITGIETRHRERRNIGISERNSAKAKLRARAENQPDQAGAGDRSINMGDR